MYQTCGYKIITLIQLCNAFGAYDAGAISFRAFRVYLGCFELRAIREASKRSKTVETTKRRRGECYRSLELARLLKAVTEAQVRFALGELERAGLLRFTESSITFTETPLPAARETIDRLAGGRKSTRPIPIPRRALRFLAGCSKPALAKTFLAYLIRGLSLDRKSGEVKGTGTVKASWISRMFAISERAARSARRELIKLEWIDKDTGSKQRKLNRDGAYFRINLQWKREGGVILNGTPLTPVVDNSGGEEFAPPQAEKSTQFAPPLQIQKTSTKYKNQKLAEREPSGFCGEEMLQLQNLVQSVVTRISVDADMPQTTPAFRKFHDLSRGQTPAPFRSELAAKPCLKNIKPEDIRRLSRLKELYEQATSAGWLERSEANFLNFAAAAVRANRAAGNSVRIFVGIVKKGLWNHVTQTEEERARQALKHAA